MGRKDYIISTLIFFCIIAISAILLNINNTTVSLVLISIVYILMISLYGCIFTIKRLHDMGYSGYWLFLIYFINFIIFGLDFINV